MKIIPKSRIEKKPGKKKTHEEYLYELYIINPNIKVLDKYINYTEKISHQCLICGHIWELRPSNALKGRGCPECAKKIRADKKRMSNEEYLTRLGKVNPTIKPLEVYKAFDISIKHKCLICNHIWEVRPNNLLYGTGCPVCANESLGNERRKTHEEYVKDLSLKNPNIEVLDIYKGSKVRLWHKYRKCNHKAFILPSSALAGFGCDKCMRNSIGDRYRFSQEEFEKNVYINNPDIKVLGTYIDAVTPVKCRCLICSHEWSPIAGSLSRTHFSGCPICNSPLGEKKIASYLNQYNIEYIPQKSYDNLVGVANGLLSYDFYLPKYNKLIEFQGEQHEHPVEYFGGEEQFKIQQEHDKRKREYAKQHNINLLEIWYYEIDEIETILENELELESVETVIPA